MRIIVDRDRVRKLLASGVTHKQIAIRMGYSAPTIAKIAKQMRDECSGGNSIAKEQ